MILLYLCTDFSTHSIYEGLSVMMNKTYYLCGALFLASMIVSPARAQLGVAAGVNFDNINDVKSSANKGNFDNATGFHFGVFYDFGAGPISLRPGIFYRNVSNVDFTVSGLKDQFDLNMVEVPVDLHFNLTATPLIKPYALAGPVFTYSKASGGELKDAVQNLNVAANIGLGLSLSVPGLGLRLFPELRYAFGISRFVKDKFEVGGVNFDASGTSRMNSFMVRLGVGL